MKLYINKKIEFASSHKYTKENLSQEENEKIFGPSSRGRYGHGHNFIAFFTFSGEINEETGMIVELSEIKQQLLGSIMTQFDHKYLNKDLPYFSQMLPTPERIAEALLNESKAAFKTWPLVPSSCHLVETNSISATAYNTGRIEKHVTLHRAINHHSCAITFSFQSDINPLTDMIFNTHTDKHKIQNLFTEIPINDLDLEKTQILFRKVDELFPLKRIRIAFSDYELDVYADTVIISASHILNATHRLKNDCISEENNQSLFGKCYNPHGHDFKFQFSKKIKPTTSDIGNALDLFKNDIVSFLEPFQYLSLEEDAPLFKGTLCTCENMIFTFKSAFESQFKSSLTHIKLQETPNNRFTLREDYVF